MFEIVENLMQSPNALLIIQEVQNRIATEAEKRKAFYNLIHEDTKAEFINGITEYWIIDADNQTVEQYILQHGEYVLE